MLLALFCLFHSYAVAAGADSAPEIRTEIKVALDPGEFLRFLDTQNLDFDQAREGAYYYYDTLALDLFKNRLIVRGRTWRGSRKGDFTVKVRPMDLSAVHEDWFKIAGFKCEYDLGVNVAIPGCGIKEERKKSSIFDVAKWQRPLSDLVSESQSSFPDYFLGAPPAWDALLVMGPIRAFTWEVSFSKDSPKATLEYWVLPDNQAMGEVSMKVPGQGAFSERDRLIEYLQANGVAKYSLDETKTRWALDYFSAQLKRFHQNLRHSR